MAMDPKRLIIVKREIIWNCWVAQGGWANLRRLKRSKTIPGIIPGVSKSWTNAEAILRYSTDSWSDVHAILGASATISRTLWPAKGASAGLKQRASELRGELNLPPLPELEDRSVRNAYEHFEKFAPNWIDEALDRFPGRPLLGWQVGDGTPYGDAKILPEQCYRYLDLKRWTLRVGLEKPLDVKQLMIAIDLLARSIDVSHRFDIGLPK